MKYFIISLVIIMHSLIFAQIQWQENGVPVRQGENIKWNGTTVTSDDGNQVCIWSDTRNGGSGIFAQKMNPEGVLFWGDEGIEVNDTENVQDFPVATTVDNNYVIVAWKNFQDWDNMEVRAQKIDADGNLLWDGEGILLGFYYEYEIEAKIYIVNDGTDGALIFWESGSFPSSSLYGIHILGDGSIAQGWEINGNLIVPSFHSSLLDIIADGYGGAVLSWIDNYYDLYMQRVDGSGNLLWGTNGTILCDDPHWYVTISTDNNGIYYFFWIDLRNYPQRSIYMQKVDQDGNILWAEDELIHQNSSLGRIKSVIGNDGYPIICWEKEANYHIELHAQKIDNNGNILWDSTGLPICINERCWNVNLIADNYEGCWITWKMGDVPNNEIYIQHVNSTGAILLEENGMLICSANNYLWLPKINNTIDDKIFISWGDNRGGSTGIYLQILNDDGQIQLAENGAEIFGGLSGEACNLKILQNGDNPFFIWRDYRYFNRSQIFIQSLNIDGSPVFQEDGIPITTFTSNNQENFDCTFNPETEEIAIVWEECRTDFKQIFAQALDTSGNFLWNETGLPVGEYLLGQQEIPQISVKEDNEELDYYVGWSDFRDLGFAIYGQKIHNGTLQWDTEGKLIAAPTGNDKLEDIVENFYIWQGGSGLNSDIFVKLVDENGNTAAGWPEDGFEICNAENRQRNPQGIITPQGLLILWKDDRSGESNIYGQIVTYDGDILWQENGLPLVAQQNFVWGYNFIYDNGLYLTWSDFRSNYYYEIYAQKFDENGNELWQEGGILVAGDDDLDTSSPDVVKVGDKILVVWQDYNNYFPDIKAQLLNESGELLWQPQGIFICDEFKDQDHPKVVSNGEDDVYIAWQDERATIYVPIVGVYAQKYHVEQTSIKNEVIPNTDFILSDYHNPFNPSGAGRSPETTIKFTTENTEKNTEINIYNIKGQKIKTLDVSGSCRINAKTTRSFYSISWDGTDENSNPVSSGIYFYKLEVDNREIATKKCLLLK